MSIDTEKFVSWAESRFGEVVISKQGDVRINSIFVDNDSKFHLWCNPHGSKKKGERKYGVYHCFKTGEKGSLAGLVMRVDGVDFDEAVTILEGEDSLAELEAKVNEFLYGEKPKPVPAPKPEPDPEENKLKLPPHTFMIDSMPESSVMGTQAEIYLRGRKIPTKGLMVCTEGDFGNRIVIPYYNRDGELIYFNARYIGKRKKTLRYLGPDAECGVGKSEVVFMPEWPSPNSKIYITEGEFDALSLTASGLYSAAVGGKELSEEQVALLRGYEICLALDNDKWGKIALMKIGEVLKSSGFQVSYVRPPIGHKDWNYLLQKTNESLVAAYVKQHEKPYDDWTKNQLEYQQL